MKDSFKKGLGMFLGVYTGMVLVAVLVKFLRQNEDIKEKEPENSNE